MKTEIVSIKFKLGTKEIEMSSEEAREIYGQLKLLFAQANENPLVIPYPVPVYPQPILWEPQPWPAPYETIITCAAEGKSTLCISG